MYCFVENPEGRFCRVEAHMEQDIHHMTQETTSTLYLLVSSADYLYKQFRPRSGLTELLA